MKKYIPFALILMFLTLAAIAYFAGSNPVLALIFAVGGVLVWALTPSGLGHPPGSVSNADPQALRKYREEHPGSTIADALRSSKN